MIQSTPYIRINVYRLRIDTDRTWLRSTVGVFFSLGSGYLRDPLPIRYSDSAESKCLSSPFHLSLVSLYGVHRYSYTLAATYISCMLNGFWLEHVESWPLELS